MAAPIATRLKSSALWYSGCMTEFSTPRQQRKRRILLYGPAGATWHYHCIESGLQNSRRPLTLSLSPSDGERMVFRPGEGNTCVTSAWWSCRVAIPQPTNSRDFSSICLCVIQIRVRIDEFPGATTCHHTRE